MIYGSEDPWGEDKLKRTRDDIDKLCIRIMDPWLRELGRGFMVQA